MSHMMNHNALKKCGSTNRNENYPTPISLVRLTVKQAIRASHYDTYDRRGWPVQDTAIRVLDLCAGNAAWGIVAKEELAKYGFNVHLVAIEIADTILPAPEVDEWIQSDFREVAGLDPFDFIFSNPPFSLVYEITAWAKEHLTEWGMFALLIGSNFMFAETKMQKWLGKYRPLFEIKLTRRPSFLHLFSERAYGEEKKNTSAKDYCTYFFPGKGLAFTNYSELTLAAQQLRLPEGAKPWLTFDQYWDYAPDPLEAVLVERPVTVQQALIREAAEAEDGQDKFDDSWSLLAANKYGWDFYHAHPGSRMAMRNVIIHLDAWRTRKA